MKYILSRTVLTKITTFYKNVAKKYRHVYSKELMRKNIIDTKNDIYKIENGLLRRQPTITPWKNMGYFMANTKKWYFAYTINNDIITVVDACHSQNMKESIKRKQKIVLKESQLRRIIRESIKKVLNII
jgi:hypothetical protein